MDDVGRVPLIQSNISAVITILYGSHAMETFTTIVKRTKSDFSLSNRTQISQPFGLGLSKKDNIILATREKPVSLSLKNPLTEVLARKLKLHMVDDLDYLVIAVPR